MTLIGTEAIGTAKIKIYVGSNGRFTADFNESSYIDDTKAGLLEKLKKAVKAAELEQSIPVTFVDLVPATRANYLDSSPFTKGRGFVHAKLRARHAREHSKFLFITDDGKTKFSHSGYNREGSLCRRLTEPELTEYAELAARLDTAINAFNEWLEDKTVRAGELLEEDK